MSSHTPENVDHVDHVDALATIIQVYQDLAPFDPAFMGLAGTVVRLSQIFQQNQRIRNFFERDDYLQMRWAASTQPLLVHNFSVTIISTRDSRPRTLYFVLAKQVNPPISSIGEWHRDTCKLKLGESERSLDIPTEPAVRATFRRLQPLFDCPKHQIARGFDLDHPPPLPHELLAFHVECQIQHALDDLGRAGAGFLSTLAWERDITRVVSAAEYADRAEQLHAVFLASTPPAVDGEQPTNWLVWEAAVEEDTMCSATIADVSEGERKKAEKRQLARFVVGWKDVVEFLGRRFSIPHPSRHVPVARG